jgi:High-temperature-induced dauer-formation protein
MTVCHSPFTAGISISFTFFAFQVRRALLDAPENVATLIRVISSRLFNLISDHTFPSPVTTSVASFTTFMKTAGSERSTTKGVLNCLRVLQRVLPVVFEIDGDTTQFEFEVLWKRDEVDDEDDPQNQDRSEASQFVIEDEDEDEDEDENGESASKPLSPPPPPPSSTTKPKEKKTLPSLAERLFSCLTDLLFCCGFTLPSKIQVNHHKINYVIWYKVFHIFVLSFPLNSSQGERSWLHR